MNDTELKNKAINWLEKQSEICRTRPYQFTPKEVADAVLGTYTALGRVADAVVTELKARGIRAQYVRQRNKRFFELH